MTHPTHTNGTAPSGPLPPGRFPLGFVVFAVGIFLVLLGMGTWQVQRYYWKRALIADYTERVRSAPMPMEQFLRDVAHVGPAMEYRRVRLTGHFVGDKHAFLVERSAAGEPGNHVLTPFRPSGMPDVTFLVDRGWIPFDRRSLATLPDSTQPPPGTEAVVRWRKSPGVIWRMVSPENTPRSATWFYYDPQSMAPEFGLDRLPPYYLMITRNTDQSYQHNLLPRPGPFHMRIFNRHLEYIATWYLLAAAWLAIAVLFVRKSLSPDRRSDS